MDNHMSIAAIKRALNEIDDINDPLLSILKSDSRQGVQQLLAQKYRFFEKVAKEKQDLSKRLLIENSWWNQGYHLLAGIDEVGRGPLAGPVVVAAVILPKENDVLLGVKDSKKLSAKKIEALANLIKAHALAYRIEEADVEEIDIYNIYEATRRAMKRAVENLSLTPDLLLIDAMTLDLDLPQDSMNQGDDKSLSIAAASILAKDYRDRLMKTLGQAYPEFGFESNVGYGTAQHLSALTTYGYTKFHRKSFAPVSQMTKTYEE